MFEILFTHFKKSFDLSKDDEALMRKIFIPRSIGKGGFLLREGEVAKYGAFVCRGLLRSYIIDSKGKEHILQFAPENWWISYKAGLPEETSTVFIGAIEDSETLLLDRPGHILLMEKIPGYAALFLTGMQKRSEVKEKRIAENLAATAEERYNNFLKIYPAIAQRIPQHMLAAYLGITPETISRVRRKAMSKK